MTGSARVPDQATLEALAERMTSEVGAALACAVAVIGDRLGLYQALGQLGAVDATKLADTLGLSPRMVTEWLLNQAAGGYISYNPDDRVYYLTPEQEALLADESSSSFLAGAFQFATAMIKAEERIGNTFRTGAGMLWGEHHPDLFQGLARFSRPIYAHQLIDVFVPAVPGLADRLQADAVVADVGAGYGHSTTLLAQRFPASRFYGFDNHPASVAEAQRLAAAVGLRDRVRFEVADATSFPDRSYDVIAFFNCMHDVAFADACARHCHDVLRADGYLFMVEPLGGDEVEDNFTPAGRLMSGASVLCCTPHGMVDDGSALGAVVADSRLREIMLGAGFSSFERVMTTRYSRVLFGRP